MMTNENSTNATQYKMYKNTNSMTKIGIKMYIDFFIKRKTIKKIFSAVWI